MTMNAHWKPVIRDSEGLGDKLKFALRRKYGDGFHARLSSSDMEYLAGLRDAGIDDASTLIDAIFEHDEVEVWEE